MWLWYLLWIMPESLRQPEAILRMATLESDDLVILDTHI